MTRADGERERVLHTLNRLRVMVNRAIVDLSDPKIPTPGPDVAQAIAHTAVDVARSLAALNAFELAERDLTRALTESGERP